MFSSLRSRLWLSYILLITVLLLILAIGLAFALAQSPRLLYPEVVFRLRLAGELVPAEIEKATGERQVERFLQREAQARNLRLVLIGSDNKAQVDTGGEELPVTRITRLERLRPSDPSQVRILRLPSSGTWLYTVRHLENNTLLLALSPAPQVPLRALFRDDFVSTFLYAGLMALAFAFLLAIAMSSWISAPLRRMVSASRAVARGEHASVPVQGPGEMQELARAMNDMSQRVQASQQSQRDFAANVSHELKTPLTSIQGFAQAILDGAAQTPEALHQAADVIYTESTRMHRLVLDLLSLARLEAGTADLQWASVDMGALLNSVVQKLSPQARSAQIQLFVDCAGLPPLMGDGDRLAQVFTNLVENAIKFTPPGGQVTVAARAEDLCLLASVTDTGIGMPEEDRARVFERFYQADKSRKGGTGHGVGLGLAIARQIVLAHGGEIWVESQPAQGSRFVVKIPLALSGDTRLNLKSKGKW